MGAAGIPNILLIMTDDQPYYTMGVMGSGMKRLVARGTRFDNGYAATPVCGPAWDSVLTGRWLHDTGFEPPRFFRAGSRSCAAPRSGVPGRRKLAALTGGYGLAPGYPRRGSSPDLARRPGARPARA